ncbi:MAG: serine/threonine-protein kinase [Candidatus Melainabacteria bacterium]|nr:serine/threonine-protein kinase [Candidatus Melainabacteria bacterium]
MTSKATKRVCAKCQFEDDTGLKICPRDGSPMTSRGKDPLIGQMIADKYEILSMLGKGGMSVVYKAKHNMMNREVAVKMLRPELVAVPQLLQRFKQESNAVSALRHPNIVTVFDYGLMSETGTPYLIMDYLEGDTLADILKRDKFLTPERAIPMFAQACDALAHAHDQGVIHRDIKPANLLIRNEKNGEESLTVFDFGIAKLLGQDGSTIHKLTTSGEVFGSPLYMSPEQCGGEHISKKTDIYSLACVFYECLCGKPPLGGTSPMETLMKHVNEDPPMLSEMASPAVQSEIPEKLEDAIMQALMKDPADRQIDMREFRDQILEAGNLRILSSSLHLTKENTLAGASEEMLAAVVQPSSKMTSSGNVPTPRRKTSAGRSNSGLPAQKGGKTSGSLKKQTVMGGGAGTDGGGKKIPMPLIIGIAVFIGFGAMAGVVYMLMHQNEAIVVEPQIEEPVKPFDESTIETKSLPTSDKIQLSANTKNFQVRVNFDGRLVAGAPTPLLVNPIVDDNPEHTDNNKAIAIPVDVKPGDIPLVQAANALFKKIFAGAEGVEFDNVSDQFVDDAETDNILVHEITFPSETPTAKAEEPKPASDEATTTSEAKPDQSDSEETSKADDTADEGVIAEGDATASDAAADSKSDEDKTADTGDAAAKAGQSSGVVKEYIIYLKNGTRLIACQILPLKITDTELKKAVKDSIQFLKDITKQ